MLASEEAAMPKPSNQIASRFSPSYKGLKPSSEAASAAARGSSRKEDTGCEVVLRSRLWRAGARFRKNVRNLPGKPDIVFSRPRLAVFCDGDFWHGKDWEERRQRLARGSNSGYWTAKIERNRERDRQHTQELEADGWTVLRFWESEIHGNPDAVVSRILAAIEGLDKSRVMA
jgi:DNA mismatch endonuclease (patch repair protein)